MKPDPGLIPFLKVNDPLPDWLLTRLDTYLEHRAQRIQFCQDEAARLRREAESLEHESRRLQFQSDIYATLRNPMRRIPPEILAKIMHWVLGGPRGFVDQSGRIHFLQLRQVAKQWRRTAYSTPSLWRFLSIDLEDFPNPTAGPSVALVTLTRRLDWWFGHAGQNAEVHLDLGIDRYSWPERVSWIGSIWGPNAKQFRLVTVQLWGQLVLGPDVQDKYPSMENLKNLSISEHISDVEQKFPALESLKFSLLNLRASLDRPFRHSRLRSLFLSSLSLEHQSFAPILARLPVLEELIMDSCYYNNIPSISAAHSITNTSLRRLVATGSVLVRWHRISFPSLQFCQIIPNTNKEFLRRWDEPYTNHLLNVITDFLERCNARQSHPRPYSLIYDPCRGHLPPFITLRAPLSSTRHYRRHFFRRCDSLEGRTKCQAPCLREVSAYTRSLRVTPLPWVRNSSPKMLSMHVPSDPNAHKPSRFLCAEMIGKRQSSTMNLVCLPELQMAAIIHDEFPIRNHEYEALRKELDPSA